MGVVLLFLISMRILTRLEIETTEHMLIEVQDYTVRLENLPKLQSKFEQYNLIELKASIYLWVQENFKESQQIISELKDSSISPEEIVSMQIGMSSTAHLNILNQIKY